MQGKRPQTELSYQDNERVYITPIICECGFGARLSAIWKLSRIGDLGMQVGEFRTSWTFPTHNQPQPTHNKRCLIRLPRSLAVPTVLQVVKPNHATLSRQRPKRPCESIPGNALVVNDELVNTIRLLVTYLDRDMELVWTPKHLDKMSWHRSSSVQIKPLQPSELTV
jgi:hypothetical protein